MAARPKSGITADTDVNLDFLTKEEKEAFLSKKMDMIRQKNKALTERHKLIEADKKKAEEAGQAVKPAIDSQSLPAEGAPKPRGRGRGQRDREANRPAKERPKSSGEFRDSLNYEPIVDTSDLASYKSKGRGLSHDRDAPSNTPKNRRKPPAKEEGNHSGQRHVNRRHDDGPPPDPSFNPLADRRRSDRKEEPIDHKRHPRNYGGGADLSRVKQSMKNMREKEKERPASNKPLEIVMTGKERKNHEEWKAERERYDKERIQRQMNEAGSWKRAWDADKIPQEYEDQYSSRLEPAKRPAGRIGSGRFDRGERDERPRSAVIGKGGLQQDHSQQQAPQRQHHHQDQQQPLSPHHPQPGETNNRAPRGRGRGRGKGRGRGNGPGGEKSPRPRTWSGGDDRFVECQKELLLVKFDNTAGDNSVEVEYDDGEFPASPPPTPKSSTSSTTPGRGPTGRTPNQTPKQQQSRGGKQQQQQQKTKAPRHKGKPQSGSQLQVVSTEEEWDAASPAAPQITLDQGSLAAAGYPDDARARTSSHSQSYGDSEEWEDCTESSGMQEEEDYMQAAMGAVSDPRGDNAAGYDLHLECKLNPEAPEFLPTSPDFMKTPPGHVKVLNWAADGSPTSPLSQGSVTSPQPLLQAPSPMSSPRPLPSSTQSPGSSPGSSASVRAARRREDVDTMPEGDQPHPPPFLLAEEAKTSTGADVQHAQDNQVKQEEKEKLLSKPEDDDDEKFEDSVDDVQVKNNDGRGQEEDKKLPQTTDTSAEEVAAQNCEENATESTSSPSQAIAGSLADELAQVSPQELKKEAPTQPTADLASELAQAARLANDFSQGNDPAESSSSQVVDGAADVVKSDDLVEETSSKETSQVADAPGSSSSAAETSSSSQKEEEDKNSLSVPQGLEEVRASEEVSLVSGQDDQAQKEVLSPDCGEASSETGSKSSPTEEDGSALPTADISAS